MAIIQFSDLEGRGHIVSLGVMWPAGCRLDMPVITNRYATLKLQSIFQPVLTVLQTETSNWDLEKITVECTEEKSMLMLASLLLLTAVLVRALR